MAPRDPFGPRIDAGEALLGSDGQAALDIASRLTPDHITAEQLVSEIANASNEQSQGIGQAATAVSQMDKVTQSNAGNAEETAAAAEELNAQSAVLKDTVFQLEQLVGGNDGKGTRNERKGREVPPPTSEASSETSRICADSTV